MDTHTGERVRRLLRRHFTQGGNGVALTVTAAATTHAVTLPRTEPDANYGVTVTPSWGTTVFVTGKTTTGFTVNFGTAAPSGASFDFITFRSE